MSTHTNITKRRVKQKNREGKTFEYDRYFLHYKDPATSKRRMRRFNTRKEAEVARNNLIVNAGSMKRRKGGATPTLAEATDYWLDSKKGVINDHTHHAYKQVAKDYIIGPMFKGTRKDKYEYAMSGKKPAGAKLIPMLNPNTKIDEITTAEIRMWQQRILSVSTTYNAKIARKHLSSIFRLIEEDYELRLARMPTRSGPSHRRKTRKLLTEDQVKLVLEHAQSDKKWGVYYALDLLQK